MAPIGTLWGIFWQAQTKILSVAALNELELKQPLWDFSNKPAEFTSKFPYGKIPTFEGSDGFALIEGATIARYLSGLGTKVSLLGSNPKEIALVDQWIHFAEQEIGEPAHSIVTMVYGFTKPFSREVLDKHAEHLVHALTHVESYLATRPSGYLVSDSMTLADLFLAGAVVECSRGALGVAERAQYPSLLAHYATVIENEKVKQFWGANSEGFTEVAIKEPRSVPAS